MSTPRHVRVFKNGRNQAVRIPREFEFSVSEATMHKEGNRLVIEPIERASLLELLAAWEPMEIDFPEILDPTPDPVEV